PLPHTSPVVQRLPSLQEAVLLTCWQPLAGTQLSVVHRLPSSQLAAVPGAQAPPAHTSPTVQALPSLQDTVLLACWQPLAGTQLSVVHRLPSSQFGAVPAWQVPPTQVSIPLHALPSLHS